MSLYYFGCGNAYRRKVTRCMRSSRSVTAVTLRGLQSVCAPLWLKERCQSLSRMQWRHPSTPVTTGTPWRPQPLPTV